ncbi:GNAT family N-acetyltransferase [Streptomyces xanthophaeus]|uniref:GNAT family N-acetyltransferase n=1 Tax=Streptomyces xanthophaeus TaxID=67385 RepID=UPI0036598DD8
MDIVIRAALPAEYGPLGEITAQAYVGDGLLGSGESFYAEVLRDVAGRAADGEVLVAVHEDLVLGGVTFAPPGSPLADMRACVARARELEGVTHLVLSTQTGMTGAQRIYARLGFVRTPERDWAPVPGLTLLTYRLSL